MAFSAPTVEEIQLAIEENRDITSNKLETRGAVRAATQLYTDAINNSEDEARANNDAEIVAKLRSIRAGRKAPEFSGIMGMDPSSVSLWRDERWRAHQAGLAKDVAKWEQTRTVAFSAISAAATVAIGGGNPVAIGAALMPLVGMLQDVANG